MTTFKSGEYSMRSLSSKTILAAAGLMLFAAGSLTPAHAQGQNQAPVTKTSNAWGCPSGWSSTKNSETDISKCFPMGSLSPKIYPKEARDTCADGYIEEKNVWCTTKGAKDAAAAAAKKSRTESKSASSSTSSAPSNPPAVREAPKGTIAKASPLDRCPLGHFSVSDMTGCTPMFSPAPRVRVNSGGCNADEIDEWGLYCTTDTAVISRAKAEAAAVRDFNQIYAANELKEPNQGDDTDSYPSMVAAYGPAGGAQTNASAQAASDDQPGGKTAQCQTADGSEVGAAIGGALGGRGGAALGGALGGLGKKKKKNGC